MGASYGYGNWDLNSLSEISEQPPCQKPPAKVVPIRRSDPPPPPPIQVPDYNIRDLEADFDRLRVEAGGLRFRRQGSEYGAIQEALDRALLVNPSDPKSICLKSISNFLASDWHKHHGGWSFRTWASNVEGWLVSAPRRNSKHNPHVVKANEEYTEDENYHWLSEAAQ
jgi:hypothetical protein